MFLWDLRKQSIDEAISSYYATLANEEDPAPREQAGPQEADPVEEPDPFMEALVRGASADAPEIDRRIVEKSDNWRLERMAAVDRNILRLAVYEMTEIGTPPPVVIDEALELARQFSGDESVSFINGVLDAVHRGSQGVPGPGE